MGYCIRTSRYGRPLVMSRRANEATGDYNMIFFAHNWEPTLEYVFLMRRLSDPADMNMCIIWDE